MVSNLNTFFNKNFTYAIVGASNNPEKYGYKILKTLLDAGITAIPINPKETQILGQKVYSSIQEIPEEVDVIDFVTPPHITLRTLEELEDIHKVWFQPGSFNEECIKFCKKNKIRYLSDFCLLASTLKNI